MNSVWIGIGILVGIILSGITLLRRSQKIKARRKTLIIRTSDLDLTERVLTVLRSDTIRMIDDIMIKDVKDVRVTIRVKGEFKKWKGEVRSE